MFIHVTTVVKGPVFFIRIIKDLKFDQTFDHVRLSTQRKLNPPV